MRENRGPGWEQKGHLPQAGAGVVLLLGTVAAEAGEQMSQRGREELGNALDVGWGMGQTGNHPAAPSSLLPDSEPDRAGSYSTWGNRVVCSRRLGKGGSQRSTGKTFRTIKSQKKCFFLLQCSQLRRVWGGAG